MNTLEGEIKSITVKESLSLVEIAVEDVRLTTIVIDTPESAPYLKVGQKVKALFKETEVFIGKGPPLEISLQNKLPGAITKIERGELLSRLSIDTTAGHVISVITTNAVNQLVLEVGTEVVAMVKTNEIMLAHG